MLPKRNKIWTGCLGMCLEFVPQKAEVRQAFTRRWSLELSKGKETHFKVHNLGKLNSYGNLYLISFSLVKERMPGKGSKAGASQLATLQCSAESCSCYIKMGDTRGLEGLSTLHIKEESRAQCKHSEWAQRKLMELSVRWAVHSWHSADCGSSFSCGKHGTV